MNIRKATSSTDMLKKINVLITSSIVALLWSCQTSREVASNNQFAADFIKIQHIVSSRLFDSNQKIIVLSFNSKNHTVDIGYDSEKLLRTSSIGTKNNALVAINGSFF